MQIEILGVYAVGTPEPYHLIECWVRGASGDFDIGKITQEVLGQSEDNWQVPWDEYRLNDDGTDGELSPSPETLNGDVRVAFFFHYLDLGRPLITPGGDKAIPAPTDRPERLSFMEYEPP